DFWRNESNGLERNIRAESHALQTGEAIDFDPASSSSGRKGLADSTTDYVTDVRGGDGSSSGWLHNILGGERPSYRSWHEQRPQIMTHEIPQANVATTDTIKRRDCSNQSITNVLRRHGVRRNQLGIVESGS